MNLHQTTRIFDIREHSKYHCSLSNYNFNNQTLNNKVKLSIKAGIFSLIFAEGHNEVPNMTDDLLHEITFRNSQFNDGKKSTFLLCNFYQSKCKKYKTRPKLEYEKEVLSYFFRTYGLTYNTQFDRIISLIEKKEDPEKNKLIDEKIFELANKQYKFLKWTFEDSSNEYLIDDNDDKAYFNILKSTQGFQMLYLTSPIMGALEIDFEDKILIHEEELDNFYTMISLANRNIMNKELQKLENEDKAQVKPSTAYEQLYIMDQLGMLSVFEEDSRTKTHQYQLLSKILGKSSENIRKYLMELDDKNPSDGRLKTITKLDHFIKHG